MRSEEEVKNKAVELYNRYHSKFLEKNLTRDGMTCKYNIRHRIRENGKIGFCNCLSKLQDECTPIFVCHDKETAEKCVYYQCSDNEQTATERFETEVNDPAVCGQKYPKLAVLIWTLQETNTDFPAEQTNESLPKTNPKNLWGRLKDAVAYLFLMRWITDG